MRTNEEIASELLEVLKDYSEQFYADEAKVIREQLVSEALKAWTEVVHSPSYFDKKTEPAVMRKMKEIGEIIQSRTIESDEKIASALRDLNLLLYEDNLTESIRTNRDAGKEKNAQSAEKRLEQLRVPSDVMLAQRWESKIQAIQDFEENPLRELMKAADPDVLNIMLQQLDAETNPSSTKDQYIKALIRDGVQHAINERLEIKASLLTDRDYYRKEEGFDESIYGSMKTGLMLKSKADEISGGRIATQQAREKLSGLSTVLEVDDNKTREDISRGRFLRASVALYNSIPLPRATVTNASGKPTVGDAYRLYEACQSPVARTILTSWETIPSFSDFYQDQKSRAVSPEVKEALVNHVIQKNKLSEIPAPNRYEVMKSVQKGSDDKKESVYQANSVEVMRSFSETLLEKITDMRSENPTECVDLLNQLGAAYEKVTASEDFYASPEIRNVVNQLVQKKPSLLEDARFAGALLQFNQVAEHLSQEPLNLGEQNNAKLRERTQTYDTFLNRMTFKNMGKNIGNKFSMAVDSESAAKGATRGQQFFRWLNSPAVLGQLKDPLNIAVGERVPTTIEFKDGSRIRITPTGNLKLEGFPLERLRSFSDAMGVRSIGNDDIKTSAESEPFHQQFMREIGHSEITFSPPGQLERMRSATSTRNMQNMQRSPEMADSRRERRLAKKLSQEAIKELEESIESEKRKSTQISGEPLAGAPRKRTRFGSKPTEGSITSEEKNPRVTPVIEAKREMPQRDIESDSAELSLSLGEESSVSPRSDSNETFSNKKSEEVRFSRGGTVSEEKGEEEQFDEFIEPMELKERVEQYRGVVSGLEISSGDRDPTLKDQLNHELAQISSELTAHSEGGIIDQGLLEETEQKLSRLQQKLNTLVKGEERLQQILKQGVKVDVGFEQTRYRVKQAQDAVQMAINDIREINLKFEESRPESAVTSVKTEVAAAQSGVKEDAKLDSSGEMIEEDHLSEIAEVTETAEEKQGPLMKVRRILADVMSSTAGVMLVKSIGDFIQTRRDQRRDAMSTKSDDVKFSEKGLADSQLESVDFDDMVANAEPLQAGNARSSILPGEADGEDSQESYDIPATGEYDLQEEKGAPSENRGNKPLSRDSMASVQEADSIDESMADEVIADDMETVSLLDSRASRGPVRDDRAESTSGGEKGPSTKETGGVAGFLRTIADVWKTMRVRFGALSARAEEAKGIDTTVVRVASAGGVAKREFNEVTLLGFAQTERNYHRNDVQESLKEWHKAFESQLQIESGSFESTSIRFAGGQSIEVKDNDVVMRGFSKEMYADLNTKVFASNPPTYRVSAANSEIYANVKKEFEETSEQKSLMSRLTSIGLFVQKLWSDAKDFVFGTATAPSIKPASNTSRTNAASSSGPESTITADVTKTRSQSIIMDSTSKIENKDTKTTPDPRRMTVAHTAETSVKPVEPARRATVGSPPKSNAGLGQSWMCVKVTIDQQPNFQSLEATLNQYSKDKNLPPIRYTNTDNDFHATVNDPQGGKVTIAASHTGQQVVITEVRHSSESLAHMANMVTALPPEGQSKRYDLSGPEGRRTEFEKKVEQSLASVKGDENKDAPTLNRSSEE